MDDVDNALESEVTTELAAVVERYVNDGVQKSAACKKLVAMPRLRQLMLRSNILESSISLANVEAILAYTRGALLTSTKSCKECKAQTKPFASCVIVEGMFQGSCAGCHYNSLGIKCSFRASKYFILYL